MRREFFALFAAAALLLGMSACSTVDNPSSGGGNAQEDPVVAPAQLKQGVWTEYDSLLVASGKYTAEELAEMPTVGMWIQGDKGYFFTYTAEDMSETVEGQISYNNNTGKGTITFPAIKDSPLSGQTVNFSMTSDETMEFELTYEGQKTTATIAWLCENLDNWFTEITDEDWKELMAYYEQYDANAGPDASIDWSDSEVEGLDKPLVWDDGIAATRSENSDADSKVKTPENIFSSIFKSDPIGDISDKLDDLLDKIDEVLANQRIMIQKLDEINNRLIAIANKMNQQEAVNIFNTRNSTYYNPLDAQNVQFFKSAFDFYNENKSNLSQENKDKLGEYAKAWAGDGKMYVDLTWNYMKYITTVQHSTYGTGMDRIYDGLTYDKYPWEHMGTGDRLSYRSYDLTMIAKCLFMITLYATYGGLSDVEKEGLYNIYSSYTPKFLAFCDFKVTNPDKFLVCQIPGAHFVMYRELQEYKYYNGVGSDAPDPRCYGPDAVYMPRWHWRGSVKIENPAELRVKLIPRFKMDAILKYYGTSWVNALIDGHQYSGGATCEDHPRKTDGEKYSLLLLWNTEKGADNGASTFWLPFNGTILRIYNVAVQNETTDVVSFSLNPMEDHKWYSSSFGDADKNRELVYLAIVAWHL
jgi:hypothetical protein